MRCISRRVGIVLLLVGFGWGEAAVGEQGVTAVGKRIALAKERIGLFAKGHDYVEFQIALGSLGVLGGKDSEAEPLAEAEGLHGAQMQAAYEAWFVIFKTLEGIRIENYDPAARENRCYLNIVPRGGIAGMSPTDVQDLGTRKEYEEELERNRERCERSVFQLALPRLDREAEAGLHKFLVNNSEPERDGDADRFADALAKSGMTIAWKKRMEELFGKRKDAGWTPEKQENRSGPEELVVNEQIPARVAQAKAREWLESGDARKAAWTAYFAARDKEAKTVPLLLAYVEKHAFDAEFALDKDYWGDAWPETDDKIDAMTAVMGALIALQVRVPEEDLLQIAAVLPDQALILAVGPETREQVLLYLYLSRGGGRRKIGEFYPAAGKAISAAGGGGATMRWVAAGNVLASKDSAEFARHMLEHFELRLNFDVVGEYTVSTGGGPSFIGEENQGRERMENWPLVGYYRFVSPTDQGNPVVIEAKEFGRDPSPMKTGSTSVGEIMYTIEPFAPGVIDVKLSWIMTRRYGAAKYGVTMGLGNAWAHWMEKMGLGEYGKGRTRDPWNPGFSDGRWGANPAKDKGFQFYDMIKVKDGKRARVEGEFDDPQMVADEEGVHAELKAWIAGQAEIYRRMVAGLRRKNLITEEDAKKPLKIRISGIDGRTPSAHSNVTFIEKAPFEDLTPAGTEMEWKWVE